MDPKEIVGSIGTPPPPGAPHEVTQALSSDLIAQQLEMARRNERALAPFNPQPGPVELPPVHIPPPATDTGGTTEPNAAEKLLEAARARTPEDRSHQPAASETDSPSRGVPTPIGDPGKQITGGFGHVGEAQYYPLNGFELAALTNSLLDKLKKRIENDLRFSMAITYPRLEVKVKLEVTGYAQSAAGDWLEYVTVPEKQTPLDVARERADQICFVVIERVQEFNAAGEPEDPPDRIREGLGLPVPRKQMINAGVSKQIVDIVPMDPESF